MWPILNPESVLAGEPELLRFAEQQIDFGTSPAEATLAAGGWGSGKTTSGLAFAAMSSYLNPPGSAGMVVQPTHQLLEEYLDTVLLPAFRDCVVGHEVGKKVLHLPGDRRILYRSGHVPERIQMSNLSWVLLDEPHLMRETVYTHAIGRARRRGSRIRVGLTSLPKRGWLSRHFEGKHHMGARCMHFRTEDNAVNLDPGYVARIKRSCPRRWRPVYLDGQFGALGDLVYAEFSRDRHIVDWEFRPYIKDRLGKDMPVQLGIAIDFSPRRPHVLFIARIPAGAVMPGRWVTTREISVVVDEIIPDGFQLGVSGVTIKMLARLVRGQHGAVTGEPYPISEAVVDPAGKAVQSTSGESEIAMLERALELPILYQFGERIRVGVAHVQLALDPLEGHPRLFFSQSVLRNVDNPRSIIRSMEGYSYPDEHKKAKADEPEHDDTYSHAADCIRYWIKYWYPQDRLSAEVHVVT
jgi:hypothetical protein